MNFGFGTANGILSYGLIVLFFDLNQDNNSLANSIPFYCYCCCCCNDFLDMKGRHQINYYSDKDHNSRPLDGFLVNRKLILMYLLIF